MQTVNTFDMKRINILIKKSDKELQQYIRALKDVSDGWERLTKKAMVKLRERENVPCPLWVYPVKTCNLGYDCICKPVPCQLARTQ